MTRRVTRDRVQQVFGPNVSPAITVSRGETIVVETQDCYQGLLAEVPETPVDAAQTDRSDRSERTAGIPVTGPIYVEDAHIGDVLSIQVKEIKTAGTGVFAVRPETGVPGQDLHKPDVRVLEVSENNVKLDDRLVLPLRPVIGNLGVAAKHGEIDTVYPGRHGGNMDTLEITTGSRVYLPVQVNGALLSLGDVKACVGDGQIAGSGVEVEAEVTLRLDTLPGGRFSWPRVESKGEWITITSASTVEQAARLAISEMVKWISQDKGLDFETAYALVSLGGSLRVSQWGNPLTTARMVFPKRLINKLKSLPAASGRVNYRSLPPATNGDADGATVAAEGEQPASRSSRRSGSSRSQRATGRSRQTGSRRGTRQKANGASSSANAENNQKEAAGQQEETSRQEAATVDTDEKVSRQEAATVNADDMASPQEAATVDADDKASPQEAATVDADDKTSPQEAATVDADQKQDTTAVDADDKTSQATAEGKGRGNKTGRTGRTGRRRRPAAKKAAAPDQAAASATAAESAPGSSDESEAPDRPAPVRSDRKDAAKPAVATRRKRSRAVAKPEANKEPGAEAQPSGRVERKTDARSSAGDAPEAVTDQSESPAKGKDPVNEESKTGSGAGQGGTGRKPTYGRRQRTVRRA